MSTYQNIKSDIISAMKSKESDVVTALRSLDSTIKNFSINSGNRSEPTEEDVISAISQLIKRGTDSAEQFKNANRNDLFEIEMFQVNLYKRYLPTQLSLSDLKIEIQNSIGQFGEVSQKDFGKLMKHFVNEYKGKTDNKNIQIVLKEILG